MDGFNTIPSPSGSGPGRPGQGKAKRPEARPAAAAVVGEAFLPLVEGDGLVFQLLPPLAYQSRSVAVAEAFVEAFGSVWKQIPRADRERLQVYWLGQKTRWPGDIPRRPPPRPLVRLEAILPPPGYLVDRFGVGLDFSASLVREPEEIRGAVATALAKAMLYAARQHFGLELSILDEPMAAWEAEQGEGVTEEACDQKHAELAAEFDRAIGEAASTYLARWGFPEAVRHGEGERGNATM